MKSLGFLCFGTQDAIWRCRFGLWGNCEMHFFFFFYYSFLTFYWLVDYWLSFSPSQVTGEQYCRAQQEAHHDSHTYQCLLASTRNHLILHNLYHGKGERSPEEVAGLVGLRLPTQPGGKGWEKWGPGMVWHWKKILNLFRNDLSVARFCHHGENSTYSCCVALPMFEERKYDYLISSSKSIWGNCKTKKICYD